MVLKLSDDILGKIAIYQTCMGYEESIRVGYQSLLTSLEAIFFGIVFVLAQIDKAGSFNMLASLGILLCLTFGLACEFRARNVDFWRSQILNLANGTDLMNAFAGSKYGWVPLGKAGRLGEKLLGHWFERIVIPAMIVIWILVWTGLL